MKIITLQKIETEPASEEIALYPDFLISALLRKGIGNSEARSIAEREHLRRREIHIASAREP